MARAVGSSRVEIRWGMIGECVLGFTFRPHLIEVRVSRDSRSGERASSRVSSPFCCAVRISRAVATLLVPFLACTPRQRSSDRFCSYCGDVHSEVFKCGTPHRFGKNLYIEILYASLVCAALNVLINVSGYRAPLFLGTDLVKGRQ